MVSSAVGAAGCDGADPSAAAPRSTLRDSAGVVIVDNEAAEATSRLPWIVGAEPRRSIGAVDGDPAYQLFRVEDALRLVDGRIVVANGGTSEIRVFDPSGEYLEAWGRGGEGPGEFTQLTEVAIWSADSVAAWDFGQQRLTLFDLDGGLGRTLELSPRDDGLGRGRLEAILPDRSIVTASLVSFDADDRTTGLVRRSRAYARVDAEGVWLNDFGRHLDEEYYVRSEVMAILRHPFRRSVHSGIWGGRVVISSNDRYEIRGYDRSGALELIVRRDHELVEVTRADLDEHISARLAAAEPSERSTLRRVFEGIPAVEHFPAFSQLLVDSTGDLWVKEYTRPGVDRPVWTVFDPDGRIRGLVETPSGVTVHEIGPDYVLGSTSDELEVEFVQLWSLRRVGS